MAENQRRPSIPNLARPMIGMLGAQVIGGLVMQLSPLMIGGFLAGLSVSERDAGIIASVEFLMLAVTAIAIAPLLPRLAYRRVGLVAVTLAVLAQGASIFSASFTSLLLLRGLAGVGEGALYAVSLCMVASHFSNPDKVYGYFQIVWALGSVALFPIGGELTEHFAHRGILALIAGVTLALAPLVFFLPARPTARDSGTTEVPARISPYLGVMTFATTVLYVTVSAALYAFSVPLGERVSLNARALGYVLTATTLVGLAGAGAATALNIRWGRAIPISAFCAGSIVIALALCLSRDPTVYVVALVSSGVIYYFSIPYLFGIAAALDRSGRWAAAAGSAYLIGFAAGPVIAGAVITVAGYAGFAVGCVCITAAAWGLAMVVDRGLKQTACAMVTDQPAQ